MNLREYLLDIAGSYDYQASMSSPAQQQLRNAPVHLSECVPAGMTVMGSGGKGSGTFTPWIGLFDPDETISPEHGLYVVYLFAEDMRSVTLMLNHGITRLDKQLKVELQKNRQKEIRRKLQLSSQSLRSRLPSSLVAQWETSVDLASAGYRQRAYEAGCVVARRYNINDLPTEHQLRADLWRIVEIYQRCILLRRDLAMNGDDPISVDPIEPSSPIEDHLKSLNDFRPKDASEYLSYFQGYEITKQRRHESMLAEYVPLAKHAGFQASNDVHPRDLLMWTRETTWLVEAKVVYNGNATNAVREAIGQLLTYRYFYHPEPVKPRLVGLFTEDVGQGYVNFLNSLEVATIWKSPDGWQGCELANKDRLIPTLE